MREGKAEVLDIRSMPCKPTLRPDYYCFNRSPIIRTARSRVQDFMSQYHTTQSLELALLSLEYGQRALYSSAFLYFHVTKMSRLYQKQAFVIFKVKMVLSVS